MDEVLAQTQSRIRSIALIHQKLYTSKDISRINMRRYTEELIIHIIDTFHVDGIEAAEQIGKLLPVKIVFMSAFDADSAVIKTRIQNSSIFLAKPFDRYELESILKALLR
jgi:DNA-binding response OmpR family regulator